jgi:glucose/arabinose dehydrogenase
LVELALLELSQNRSFLPQGRRDQIVMIKRSVLTLAIASLFSVTSPAGAAIQLVPVVSGLSNPLFVGHAGDGTNRLFIVERGGTIRVLQPGSSSPTLFLDIHTKVATAGGEQGLLGLAFHPNYAINRRFFVYYSRTSDGAEVIAEYTASASNPDVADPTEKILVATRSLPTGSAIPGDSASIA